jgi:hypothetical protein
MEPLGDDHFLPLGADQHPGNCRHRRVARSGLRPSDGSPDRPDSVLHRHERLALSETSLHISPMTSMRRGFAAVLSKSARILWWTHLAWTIIGFIHIYVRLNRKPREAHLILDMAVAGIYIGVALSVMGFVFGLPIATLVTTSGVVAVILGLAHTEHVRRCLFRHRADTRQGLCDWRLGPVERRHCGPRHRNQLALHQPADRIKQYRRAAEQHAGKAKLDQLQPPRRDAPHITLGVRFAAGKDHASSRTSCGPCCKPVPASSRIPRRPLPSRPSTRRHRGGAAVPCRERGNGDIRQERDHRPHP